MPGPFKSERMCSNYFEEECFRPEEEGAGMAVPPDWSGSGSMKIEGRGWSKRSDSCSNVVFTP